jgi:hypothetical protein
MGTFHDNQVSNIIPQPEEDQGILTRFMSTLFERLVEMADPGSQDAKIKLRSYTLKIGFIELYNEDFYDLLKPPASEKIDSATAQWQPLSSPKADRVEKREKNANIQSKLVFSLIWQTFHFILTFFFNQFEKIRRDRLL